jgi:hypothetical protein
MNVALVRPTIGRLVLRDDRIEDICCDEPVDLAAINARISWGIATLPSLLLRYASIWRFQEWLRLAGGATAIVVVLITLPFSGSPAPCEPRRYPDPRS